MQQHVRRVLRWLAAVQILVLTVVFGLAAAWLFGSLRGMGGGKRTDLAVVLVLGLMPAFIVLWYLAVRAWRRPFVRTDVGQCAGCGYPRAGLTPTTPCPECGHEP